MLAHKVLHEGCPVAEETECPPVFQARLASESAISALDEAWRSLGRRAADVGGELVLIKANVERSFEPKTLAKLAKEVRPDPSEAA